MRFLGRKAELPNLLRDVGKLPPQERGPVGKGANQARQALQAALDARLAELEALELEARLAADVVDVTLPGSPVQPAGHLHILTATRREIEDVFVGLGFRVVEGPGDRPRLLQLRRAQPRRRPPGARASRTRSTSPTTSCCARRPRRCRCARWSCQPPPLYIIVPGRVYRPDNDATHTPQFHQVEGLAVDEDLTLGDLQGTLLAFARAIFGDDREVRLRPHYFPFTEPSVELDVSCFNCTQGFLHDGSRCPLCKGTAWIEILGAGMVDPNVYGYVADSGYDAERHQGFAWGMGIERIAFLKHRVPDLRMFYENDLRLLGAVRMKLPLFWLTDYVDPGLEASALAARLAMTGTEVDRVLTHGVSALDSLRRRPRALARAAPGRRPAVGLHRVHWRGRHGPDRLRRAERRPRARPSPSRCPAR